MNKWKPGPLNLISDVPGVRIGNADDTGLKSGVTVFAPDRRFTAAVHVMGGAPGSRDTDLLAPENTIDAIDALVLSGGSAFGLDAPEGVVRALRAEGRGLEMAGHIIPLVPSAVIFDLPNGGDKAWTQNPYPDLGYRATRSLTEAFAIGTAGAGVGAMTADLKGGLGSASIVLEGGATVGALVVANPVGTTLADGGPAFWAAPFEIGDEFGGVGTARTFDTNPVTKIERRMMNTAIAIVATDVALDKTQAKRLAISAHDGIARAIVPAHTPYDGDLIFAASVGDRPMQDPVLDPLRLGHAAATVVTRAIARAVHAARPAPGDLVPTWQDRFGG